MAIVTGEFLTFSAIGNREDLTDMIYNISPVDTPFMGTVAKTKAEGVLHEWQTDSLAAAATNAQLQGDDIYSSYTFTSVTPTTRLGNRTQIMRKDVVVSGTQDAVSKAGRKKEIVYQLTKKAKELKRDMEFGICNNQAPVTGNSTTAPQLRPVLSWYSTNVSAGAGGGNGSSSTARTDGTQRALTESLMKGQLQGAWTQGGDVDTILSGAFNKSVISTFAGNVTRTQDTSDGKVVASLDVYESDFGIHRIVPDRFSRDRDLHLLTTDLWAVANLRPFQTIDLAKTGDNEKGMILVEFTIESRNEAGSALVADLLTA